MGTLATTGRGVSALPPRGITPKAETTPVAPPKKEDPVASKDDQPEKTGSIEALVKELNQAITSFTSLDIQVEEETEKVVVKVVDRDTGDLVRQIPQEELVELAKKHERRERYAIRRDGVTVAQ
jgi:flagellar protein FlaG